MDKNLVIDLGGTHEPLCQGFRLAGTHRHTHTDTTRGSLYVDICV